MKLESLSASSARLFEQCERAWGTRYAREDGERPQELVGDAALLGTAVHDTLERWVVDGHHLKPHPKVKQEQEIIDLYSDVYWQHFSHGDRFDDGKQMVVRWIHRTDFTGREVLSTERKSKFHITSGIGKIPVVYVFDRKDDLGGDIEIVDYKTSVMNVYPDKLKNDIQARVYALAAQIEHPEAERIWVTFDMLRYSDVGVQFTKTDNRQTLRYLEALAERIIASDGSKETLNPGCRWCVRKHECATIKAHLEEGGPLDLDDIDDIVTRRHQYDIAVRTLGVMRDELDEAILEYADTHELDVFQGNGVDVRIGSRPRREVNVDQLVEIIGDNMSRFLEVYGGVGVRNVEQAIRDDWGGPMTQQALRNAVKEKHTKSRVSTEKS